MSPRLRETFLTLALCLGGATLGALPAIYGRFNAPVAASVTSILTREGEEHTDGPAATSAQKSSLAAYLLAEIRADLAHGSAISEKTLILFLELCDQSRTEPAKVILACPASERQTLLQTLVPALMKGNRRALGSLIENGISIRDFPAHQKEIWACLIAAAPRACIAAVRQDDCPGYYQNAFRAFAAVSGPLRDAWLNNYPDPPFSDLTTTLDCLVSSRSRSNSTKAATMSPAASELSTRLRELMDAGNLEEIHGNDDVTDAALLAAARSAAREKLLADNPSKFGELIVGSNAPDWQRALLTAVQQTGAEVIGSEQLLHNLAKRMGDSTPELNSALQQQLIVALNDRLMGERAWDFIQKLPPSAYNAETMKTAAQTWAMRDPFSLSEFLHASPTCAHRDELIAALVESIPDDQVSAAAWAERIADPEVRQQALARIRTR